MAGGKNKQTPPHLVRASVPVQNRVTSSQRTLIISAGAAVPAAPAGGVIALGNNRRNGIALRMAERINVVRQCRCRVV